MTQMRELMLAIVGAAAMLVAGALGPAGAITIAPAAVRAAIETVNPVEKALCWRWGWHGWGYYPCGYWIGPRWGWRRLHRHWRHW
jgi:hypothetical protein